jgi:hypothetical protein
VEKMPNNIQVTEEFEKDTREIKNLCDNLFRDQDKCIWKNNQTTYARQLKQIFTKGEIHESQPTVSQRIINNGKRRLIGKDIVRDLVVTLQDRLRAHSFSDRVNNNPGLTTRHQGDINKIFALTEKLKKQCL